MDKSIKGKTNARRKLKLRESKGLLQRQVAAELAVDTAYISKMENNDKPVSKSHLEALSKFTNYPKVNWFMVIGGKSAARF